MKKFKKTPRKNKLIWSQKFKKEINILIQIIILYKKKLMPSTIKFNKQRMIIKFFLYKAKKPIKY